jgi:hypothetical protein
MAFLFSVIILQGVQNVCVSGLIELKILFVKRLIGCPTRCGHLMGQKILQKNRNIYKKKYVVMKHLSNDLGLRHDVSKLLLLRRSNGFE